VVQPNPLNVGWRVAGAAPHTGEPPGMVALTRAIVTPYAPLLRSVHGRQDTVRCDDCRATRRERPVVILCAPAVLGSPVGLGHPDTHRMRTCSTSPLAATVAHHTVDRDVAWHGRPESDGASAPMRHPLPYVRGASSRHVTGVCVPSRHARMSGALARPAWLACAGTATSVYHPAWDSQVAGRGLVSPNPRVLRPAAPRPRLWSALRGPQCPACVAAPSVSRWRDAGATGPPPPRGARPRGAAHNLPRAPAHRAAG
jgi:hypothetical protein